VTKYERHEAVRAGIDKVRKRDGVGWYAIAKAAKIKADTVMRIVEGKSIPDKDLKKLEMYLWCKDALFKEDLK
jgi:hypothetical protein